MKKFDKTKIKVGDWVKTRDGRDAQILCIDLKNGLYNIVARVKKIDIEEEYVCTYDEDGCYLKGSQLDDDLMLPSIKKEGWILIRHNTCLGIYQSTEELNNKCNNIDGIVLKIEWEE